MATTIEEWLSRALQLVLADLPTGAYILDSDQFREVLSGLECFIPKVLVEIHPEWKHESLDGILPIVARKTGDREAEIIGECILISDQTLTPLHLRLQVSVLDDEVSWLECKLGERGEHGMVRTPYSSSTPTKKLYALVDHVERIDWVYQVTFGVRRH